MKKANVVIPTNCSENAMSEDIPLVESISSGKESYNKTSNASCISDSELPNLMTTTLAKSPGNSVVDPAHNRLILVVSSRNGSHDSFEMEEVSNAVRRETQQTSSASPGMATQLPNYQGSFHETEGTDTIWNINILEVGNCKDGNWETNIDEIESKGSSGEWKMGGTNEISIEPDNDGKNWSSNVDDFIEGVELRDQAWKTDMPSIHIPTMDGWSANVNLVEVSKNDQWEHNINTLSESKEQNQSEWDFKLHQNPPDLNLGNKWNAYLKEVNVGKCNSNWKSDLSNVLHKSDINWKMQIKPLKEKEYSQDWRGVIDTISLKNEGKWKVNVEGAEVSSASLPGKWKEKIDNAPYKGIDDSTKWKFNLPDIDINDEAGKNWRSVLSEVDTSATTRNDADKWMCTVDERIEQEPSNWSSDLNVNISSCDDENKTNWNSNIRDVNSVVDSTKLWKASIGDFSEQEIPCICADINEVHVERDSDWVVDAPPLVYSEGSSCIVL